nr:MAG TPA: hypothetical protein [Caudoviricetes sp.]
MIDFQGLRLDRKLILFFYNQSFFIRSSNNHLLPISFSSQLEILYFSIIISLHGSNAVFDSSIFL